VGFFGLAKLSKLPDFRPILLLSGVFAAQGSNAVYRVLVEASRWGWRAVLKENLSQSLCEAMGTMRQVKTEDGLKGNLAGFERNGGFVVGEVGVRGEFEVWFEGCQIP